MTVTIVTDDTFSRHQGFDLARVDDDTLPTFLVSKQGTYEAFKRGVAEHFDCSNAFLLWPLMNRQNGRCGRINLFRIIHRAQLSPRFASLRMRGRLCRDYISTSSRMPPKCVHITANQTLLGAGKAHMRRTDKPADARRSTHGMNFRDRGQTLRGNQTGDDRTSETSTFLGPVRALGWRHRLFPVRHPQGGTGTGTAIASLVLGFRYVLSRARRERKDGIVDMLRDFVVKAVAARYHIAFGVHLRRDSLLPFHFYLGSCSDANVTQGVHTGSSWFWFDSGCYPTSVIKLENRHALSHYWLLLSFLFSGLHLARARPGPGPAQPPRARHEPPRQVQWEVRRAADGEPQLRQDAEARAPRRGARSRGTSNCARSYLVSRLIL
ncbi:hypothetical protein DFH09DRAFT_160061 [Mycena vulgaris]|nr:hypothetical protein DFH09DRAFT_160061 [Mycena vulgaris]